MAGGYGNQFKTVLLLGGLTILLVLFGRAIGGQGGMIFALFLAAVMNIGGYWFSDRIAIAMTRSRPVSEAEAPELYAIVRHLTDRAGMPMPRLFLTPSPQPNAFATGRDPAHAAVAVTDGLLQLLNRDELAGVLAHELAHVRNRDILIQSLAAVLAGAITTLANMLQWTLLFGFGRQNDEEGGNPIAAMAMMILAPIAAMLVQLAISRSREYQADATGAEICGDPLALASALRKLQRGAQLIPMAVNPAASHMFIVNPLSARTVAGLFSTHPALEDRIARLEAMASAIRR